MCAFLSDMASSAKSLVKVLVQSRPVKIPRVADPAEPFVVLGNGPSLASTINDHLPFLRSHPCMAVNFAANTPEFGQIRPSYYILADPHFFEPEGTDRNVDRLWKNISSTRWDMTLFVPARVRRVRLEGNPRVSVARFNPVGFEGFGWLERCAYRSRMAMPRPRNVLIPAIMCALAMGAREIYVAGADHSWMRTLSVDERNCVVSVQPHFYADSDSEKERVTAVYSGVRLHDIVLSFHIAFRAYHRIAAYARSIGAHVYNVTPESMIDAFPRKKL